MPRHSPRARAIRIFAAFLTLVCVSALRADISGFVRETGTPDGIGGAFVHLRADPSTGVYTLPDGSFTLTADPRLPHRCRRLDPVQPRRRRQLLDRRRLRLRRRHRRPHRARPPPHRRRPQLRPRLRRQLRHLPQVGLLAVGGLQPRRHGAQRVGDRPLLGQRHAGRRRRLRLPRHPRCVGDRLLLHLPRADGGGARSRQRLPRRGHRARRARGRQLRHLPPARLRRRQPRPPQRPPPAGQGHLPLPAGEGRDGDLRLGTAQRRHLRRHAGVALDAAQAVADLRLLPPVQPAEQRRRRPAHLHRVAGLVVRGPRARLPHLPGLPHAAVAGAGTLCVFSDADRPGDQRRQHTFVGSTPEMLQDNLSLTAVAVRGRPRAASASPPTSPTSAPATPSRPASRSATPCSWSPPPGTASRSPRPPAPRSRSGQRRRPRRPARRLRRPRRQGVREGARGADQRPGPGGAAGALHRRRERVLGHR